VVSREAFADKRWKGPADFRFAAGLIVVPVSIGEMAHLGAALPLGVVDEGASARLVAVLGFPPTGNLLVDSGGRWLAPGAVPALLRFYPFRLAALEGSPQKALAVDVESGLVGGEGEPFFDGSGEPSEKVLAVAKALTRLDAELEATARAVGALKEAGVLRPWAVQVRLAEGEVPVEGLFRVDEAALQEVEDRVFLELRRAGALGAAYGQLFSLPRMGALLELARRVASAPRPSQDQDLESLLKNLDTLPLSP